MTFVNKYTIFTIFAILLQICKSYLQFQNCFDVSGITVEDHYSYGIWTVSPSSNVPQHVHTHLKSITDYYFEITDRPLLILTDNTSYNIFDSSKVTLLYFDFACLQVPRDLNPVIASDIVRVVFNNFYDILYHDLDIVWVRPTFLRDLQPKAKYQLVRENGYRIVPSLEVRKSYPMNGIFNFHGTDYMSCVMHEIEKECIGRSQWEAKPYLFRCGKDLFNECFRKQKENKFRFYGAISSDRAELAVPNLITLLTRRQFLCRTPSFREFNCEISSLPDECVALHLSVRVLKSYNNAICLFFFSL